MLRYQRLPPAYVTPDPSTPDVPGPMRNGTTSPRPARVAGTTAADTHSTLNLQDTRGISRGRPPSPDTSNSSSLARRPSRGTSSPMDPRSPRTSPDTPSTSKSSTRRSSADTRGTSLDTRSRRVPRQTSPRPADDIPVFDRNKVSLDLPGNLFGPSVSLLIRTTKIVGDVIQNSAVRYQTFLRLFRPLFRGPFEIKGLDPPTTTTTTARPRTTSARPEDNEIRR